MSEGPGTVVPLHNPEAPPTWRLRKPDNSRRVLAGLIGLSLGIAANALAKGTLGQFALLIPVLAGALGLIFGSRGTYWTCAASDCGMVLGSDASTCPKCGGAILGEVGSTGERQLREDRLESEEAGYGSEDEDHDDGKEP